MDLIDLENITRELPFRHFPKEYPVGEMCESWPYLIRFSGYHYEVGRWSEEHHKFYIHDTFFDAPFEWMVLPLAKSYVDTTMHFRRLREKEPNKD